LEENGMNRKISGYIFIGIFILVLIAAINADNGFDGFEPISIKGEMSEITLAYAKRQNYITREGKREIYPDGIVFYFVINRLKDNLRTPTIVELRDFTVNGVSYLDITRKNNIIDIEPNTIIYNEQTFRRDEFHEKINIQEGTGILIEKVIICGSTIQNGIIGVNLRFGFDNKIEEFNFQFNLNKLVQ
jgi:hypothetical protein